MKDEVTYLTEEGATRLRAELESLKGPAREEIAKRLRTAIQQGDLSENAEYITTKEEQAFLEGRIQDLETLLKNATIIAKNDLSPGEVAIGVRVTIQESDNPPETYQVVGAMEADPRNGRISNESPIGQALIGHREGDQVAVNTPAGKLDIKILKID